MLTGNIFLTKCVFAIMNHKHILCWLAMLLLACKTNEKIRSLPEGTFCTGTSYQCLHHHLSCEKVLSCYHLVHQTMAVVLLIQQSLEVRRIQRIPMYSILGHRKDLVQQATLDQLRERSSHSILKHTFKLPTHDDHFDKPHLCGI